MVGSLEVSQTASRIGSGLRFGRESDRGLDCEWLALSKRVRQRLGLGEWSTLWQRVGQQLLSTNLTIADTLRPSSMLSSESLAQS